MQGSVQHTDVGLHGCVRLCIGLEKILNVRTSIPKRTTFLMAGRDLRMFSMSGVTIENVLLSKVPKCRDPRDPRSRAGSKGPKAVCSTTFFERRFSCSRLTSRTFNYLCGGYDFTVESLLPFVSRCPFT